VKLEEDESKREGLIKLHKNLNEVTCGSFCIIHENSGAVAKISSGIRVFLERPSSTVVIPLSTEGTKRTLDNPSDVEETKKILEFVRTGLNAADDILK
jgi:hypothetical protein